MLIFLAGWVGGGRESRVGEDGLLLLKTFYSRLVIISGLKLCLTSG